MNITDQNGKKMQIRKCVESDIAAAGEFYDSVVRWLDAHINYPRWILPVGKQCADDDA